ncbi:transmembrane protein 209 [Epargyreus clarus]|uniref:transmembrane protein 209 n=1 Tax=Epargyreus clarus TaxID=520877 RepID=UPI003C2D648E
MSLSPNSALVQRTIDMHYANRKRSNSIKWIAVNSVFLILFVYDLWCKCPGYTTGMHYAELGAAGALLAALAHHAAAALRRAPPLRVSPAQRRLLGLSDADLDSSFVLAEPGGAAEGAAGSRGAGEAPLSLARAWRPGAPRSPPSPPPAAPDLRAEPPARDLFIADRRSLADYLKQYEERAQPAAGGPAWPAPAPMPPPAYQLAALDKESSNLDETSPQGSPQVWWRLHLDPQRLTQWNLNLRLWIHVTILERLVRELRAAGAGAAAGGAGGAGPAAAHPALMPFLEPFADQRYVVQRITELAQGGCLSNYKWNGGGSDWDESKPTDAEIVLHLLATYLDGQMPQAGNPRPFSSQYLSAAPGEPRALALRRVALRPPHFALELAGETLEVARGRNNLLHCLLLLLAAAARRRPPALARTHLGPAGLNMLWIIGR